MKRNNAARPINPGAASGFEGLRDPLTRNQALVDIGQWVIDTCMVFGCRPELAWEVAGMFVGALRRDLEAPE